MSIILCHGRRMQICHIKWPKDQLRIYLLTRQTRQSPPHLIILIERFFQIFTVMILNLKLRMRSEKN